MESPALCWWILTFFLSGANWNWCNKLRKPEQTFKDNNYSNSSFFVLEFFSKISTSVHFLNAARQMWEGVGLVVRCGTSRSYRLSPVLHSINVLVVKHQMLDADLHSVLGSPVQERHGTVRADPEMGHKDAQRAGAPLLWWETERIGVSVHPELGKTLGKIYSSCSINEGELMRKTKIFYQGPQWQDKEKWF